MTLTTYLDRYHDFQSEILLVYRALGSTSWSDRCLYLGPGYEDTKPYNHRVILRNEIVIEFDSDDVQLNRKLADKVAQRLRSDNIKFAKWTSGNKSVHVHCIVRTGDVRDRALLKRVFTQHYCSDLPFRPDLQLTHENHLIRAEYGVHEKTGRRKTLISKDSAYPCFSEIPLAVWEKYNAEFRQGLARRLVRNKDSIKEHPGFKFLITTQDFGAVGDGRERALFLVTHALKNDFGDNKEAFTQYIQDWYKYSGGRQKSQADIARFVNYHWNKTYHIGSKAINNFMEEIGRKDLVQ
jgi:hypothetical protein